MARPRKETADWFSHDAYASEDEKLLRLQARYGAAGYSFFFHVLELLCQAGFKIKNPDQWWFELYGQKWGIKEAAMKDILQDCLQLKLLQLQDGHIVSKNLVSRLEPLFLKRERDRVGYCVPVSEAKTPVSEAETIISDNESTHRKGKYSKEEKREELDTGNMNGGVTHAREKNSEKEEKNEEQKTTHSPPYQEGIKQKTPKGISKEFFLLREKQEELVQILVREKGVPVGIAALEVQKFVAYWTERNGTGTKMRWEMEKTFELSRRLTTWFSRVRNYTVEKGPNKDTVIADVHQRARI